MLKIDRNGFALIMTLWVLVFLTIAVTSFSLSSRWSLVSTSNFRNETEAYYLALAGYDIARNYLMNDDDTQVDFIDEKGIFYVDNEHEPLLDEIPMDSGVIHIGITDEQGRININRVQQQTLRKLFEFAGVEFDLENTLVDSLLDWIDSGDGEAHHVNGAEDDYYEEFGYKSKDKPLDTVEELILIKGYSEELLFGSDKYTAIHPFLSVYGNGTFNVNTISGDVMKILGVNQIDIENVMQYRDRESNGLRVVPSGLRQFGIATTSSIYLRLEIEAEVQQSGIKYMITTVVKRTPVKTGFKVEPIFWREDVIYS